MSLRPPHDTQSVPVIRPLQSDQIDAAIELFRAQLEEHKIETRTESLRQVIESIVADDRYGFILVAVTGNGKLVGLAFGSAFLGVEHGGPSGWLEELYVLPDWRQNGLGTRLVNEAIRAARARGWRALDLEVDASHQRAASLYQRHGFRPKNRSRYCLKLD
jgi:ribosomal protein S18 acetylase RimI-like enzyme